MLLPFVLPQQCRPDEVDPTAFPFFLSKVGMVCWNKIHFNNQLNSSVLKIMWTDIYIPGQENYLRSTCPMGKWVFWFPCPTLNSTCSLRKLERTERTSALYHLSERCAEELCPYDVYLSKERVNTDSHLFHSQNNLSQMSGHSLPGYKLNAFFTYSESIYQSSKK